MKKKEKEFSEQWNKISISIKTLNYRTEEKNNYLKRLSFDLPSVSVDFIAEDIDPIRRNGLYHCHNFTKSIFMLNSIKRRIDRRASNFINGS